MDSTVLYFPQGNDVIVTARYPAISDGTGMQAELYRKGSRYIPDEDPSTIVYAASIDPDPDNPGATMSTFTVPASDTADNGAFWWRVDALDSFGKRRTANCGPLLVEAVLWETATVAVAICRSNF